MGCQFGRGFNSRHLHQIKKPRKDNIPFGAFSLDVTIVVTELVHCEAVLRGSTPATSTNFIDDASILLVPFFLFQFSE